MRCIGHAGLALDRPCGAPDRHRLERAASLGLDRLELDVAECGSGELVLLHDLAVAGGLEAGQAGLDRLRAAIPGLLTLDEAVEQVAGRVPLLLDLKGPCAPALGRWLRDAADPDALAACTDDLAALLILRHTAPRVARWRTLPAVGEGRGSGRRRVVASALRATLPARLHPLCREVAAEAVCVDRWAVTPRLCEAGRRAGILVDAWTVNDPRLAQRLATMGVGAVTTDLPETVTGHDG